MMKNQNIAYEADTLFPTEENDRWEKWVTTISEEYITKESNSTFNIRGLPFEFSNGEEGCVHVFRRNHNNAVACVIHVVIVLA